MGHKGVFWRGFWRMEGSLVNSSCSFVILDQRLYWVSRISTRKCQGWVKTQFLVIQQRWLDLLKFIIKLFLPRLFDLHIKIRKFREIIELCRQLLWILFRFFQQLFHFIDLVLSFMFLLRGICREQEFPISALHLIVFTLLLLLGLLHLSMELLYVKGVH